MPLNTLLPAFNEQVMGGGPDNLGFLVSAMGLGAIVGSLMMATMGGLLSKGLWLIGSCLVWGALTAAFGLSEAHGLIFVLIAAIGWVSSWNMSLNRGMLQMQVDNQMRGRIMSIDMMSPRLDANWCFSDQLGCRVLWCWQRIGGERLSPSGVDGVERDLDSIRPYHRQGCRLRDSPNALMANA